MDASALPDPPAEFGPLDSSILVPELRDYHRINKELVRRLDRGDARVRVEGAEGHRLLLAGLTGTWRATVEIVGRAGPELCFGMNAPGVIAICRGPSGDGAGGGLRAGGLVLLGPSGTAVGYHQEGGLIVASGGAGPRAGLRQRGGNLVILDSAGPFAGEAQRGGRLLLPSGRVGRRAGRGASGGQRLWVSPWSPSAEADEAIQALQVAAKLLAGRASEEAGSG